MNLIFKTKTDCSSVVASVSSPNKVPGLASRKLRPVNAGEDAKQQGSLIHQV